MKGGYIDDKEEWGDGGALWDATETGTERFGAPG